MLSKFGAVEGKSATAPWRDGVPKVRPVGCYLLLCYFPTRYLPPFDPFLPFVQLKGPEARPTKDPTMIHQRPTKHPPKTNQKINICFIFHMLDFWWVFGGSLVPHQTPTKHPPKTHQSDPPKTHQKSNTHQTPNNRTPKSNRYTDRRTDGQTDRWTDVSAVAGTQLCCAVGSAAPGLWPAHGVWSSFTLMFLLIFLSFSYPSEPSFFSVYTKDIHKNIQKKS